MGKHTTPWGGFQQIRESGLWLSDTTINDVTTARHGLVPKAPNDTSKFLRGDATWATPPGGGTATFVGCRVYNSADQTISNNLSTILTFDSERYDTDGFHSTSSNTSRLTIPTGKAGYYRITGCVAWAPNATGFRNAYIFLNGTTGLAVSQGANVGSSAGFRPIFVVTTDYYLNVGDYVELGGYQNSGGNLNVVALANYSAEFMLHLLGT